MIMKNVKNIKALELKGDEVLFFELKNEMTSSDYEILSKKIDEAFPNHACFILDNDLVLREDLVF
jgi:hypothetical protein